MSTNVTNSNVVNNSNQLENSMFNLYESFALPTSNEVIVRGKIPFKNKVITSIEKEIEIIRERENLSLRKVAKMVKGVRSMVNENRFWKQSILNPNNLLVSVKVKGKIVKFSSNDETKYFMCENTKESLIGLLNSIKNKVESIGEDHPIWKLNEETKKSK